MNAKNKKTAPVLYGAIGLIVLALAGLGAVVVMQESKGAEEAKKSQEVVRQKPTSTQLKTGKSKAEKALKEKAAERDKWVETADTTEEMKKILRQRVRQTTDELNEVWLADLCQYVSGQADLQSYYQDKFSLGAQFEPKAMAKDKKMFSSNPQAFIEKARKDIYSRRKKPTVEKINRDSRAYLALALYKAEERMEGLENTDPVFMTSYFRTTIKMYELLQELTGDRDRWWDDMIKTHEAYLWERFRRIQRQRDLIQDRRSGTSISAEPDLLRVKRLNEHLNETLLALGKIYSEAAQNELDRKKLQFYTEQAFKALAMVYQRTLSGGAINTLFAVDQIQKDYLYRMAINSWKRARLAKDDGRYEEVDEHYFHTAKFYYQLMARWREGQKRRHTAEFLKLKQEVAAWKLKKQQMRGSAADEEG